MNFSQFSKNKLDKEQMMAVKGGQETCEDWMVFDSGNRIKKCVTDGVVKYGYSFKCPDDPNFWGWLDMPCLD